MQQQAVKRLIVVANTMHKIWREKRNLISRYFYPLDNSYNKVTPPGRRGASPSHIQEALRCFK
jgi:hypothetical protein